MTEPSATNQDPSQDELEGASLGGLLDIEAQDDDESLDFAGQRMLNEVKASVLRTPLETQHIGRFRIIAEIGRGAMGTVYEADDDRLRRKVAIKLLHRGIGGSDRERRARLQREAQALAQLSHPNLVQVYEVGEHEGHLFMVMELVSGKTLDRVQADTPVSEWRRILGLYLMAGKGLAAAHAKNVVHRDFKPHNVIVDDIGTARVVDFGLARGTLEAEEPTTEIPAFVDGAIERPQLERLTASGDNPGTPRFMAPELFAHQPATPASDQYSLCVALYEAIYHQHPFAGTKLQEFLAEARVGRIRPTSEFQPSRPRWLFTALRRGLAPEPEDRFPSLEALLTELGKDRRRKWRVTAFAIALLTAVGAAWWARGRLDVDTDALAAERKRSCLDEGSRMRATWENARNELFPPRSAEDDVLDVEVGQLITTWEDTCVVDTEAAHEDCRELARGTYDSLVKPDGGPLPEGAFYSVARDLELCVESRADQRCGRPTAGSEAATGLAAARAAYERDDLSSALRLAEAAQHSAIEDDDSISNVRALLLRGTIHEKLEQLDRARSVLDEGLEQAMRCGLDTMVVDLGLERIEVASLHGGRAVETELLLVFLRGLLRRPSMQDLLLHRAQFHMKEGGVRLYLEGHCSEAMAAFDDAQELLDEATSVRRDSGRPTTIASRFAAETQLNIANAKLDALVSSSECGAALSEDEILSSYRAARERFIEATGNQQSLGLVEFEFSEGVASMTFGRTAEAIERFHAAMAIYRRHVEPNNPLIGDVHRALAAAFRDTGDLDAALEHAQANLALRRGWSEGEPLPLAEAYDTVGVLLTQQGKPNEAIALHDASIEALTSAGRPQSNRETEQLIISYVNLGDAKWDAEDVDGAHEAAARARDLTDASADRAHPLLSLLDARLRRARGDHDGALQSLDEIAVEDLPTHEAEIRWEYVLLTQAREEPLDDACTSEIPTVLRLLRDSNDSQSLRLRSTIEGWRSRHC